MSTSPKLLLHTGVLRRKQARKNGATRGPSGARHTYSKDVEGSLDGSDPWLWPRASMPPRRLPTRSTQAAPGEAPAARWTRYGRWSEDGSQVLNNLGRVIYEHP